MKPIIFSTEMVRAILDDRKTQTRRVIRPQPDGVTVDGIAYKHVTREFVDKINGKLLRLTHDRNGDPFAERIKPRYRPGDTLYVREAWLEENGRYFYRADYEDGLVDPCETLSGGYPSECRYYPECVGCQRTAWRPPWKPSIHMPREAARLFLLVKNVRVERLQDITHVDAQCEGVEMASDDELQEYGYRAGFKQLWDSLNAKRGYSWESNPWVEVIEFERTEVAK